MRHRLLTVVAIGIALGFAVFAAVPAAAAPPPQTQELKLSGDPHVTGSNSLTLKATKIAQGTLALACFTFTFAGDLLDPGEGFTITPDGSSGEGPGFENPSTGPPLSTRTLCSDDPAFLGEIADGNSAEQFVLRANPASSTFTVSSVTMTLTYA
jgi:hypothetical protein